MNKLLIKKFIKIKIILNQTKNEINNISKPINQKIIEDKNINNCNNPINFGLFKNNKQENQNKVFFLSQV